MSTGRRPEDFHINLKKKYTEFVVKTVDCCPEISFDRGSFLVEHVLILGINISYHFNKFEFLEIINLK